MEFLNWKHVNFNAEEVTITTYEDKNTKQWDISVSTRLKSELLKLKLQRKSDDPDERLFASASVNLRKVWEAARKEAGKQAIPNLAREPPAPSDDRVLFRARFRESVSARSRES